MERKIIKAIVLAGGGNCALANRLGITPQAISMWISSGRIPIDRVITVSRVTGIPPHKIRPDRPDLFPPGRRTSSGRRAA